MLCISRFKASLALPLVPLEPVIINMVGCRWWCIPKSPMLHPEWNEEGDKQLFLQGKKSPSITPQIYIHIQDRCVCVKNIYAYPHILEVLELHWDCAEFRAKPKFRFQGTEILPTVFSKCWLQMLKISWDQLFFWAFLHHGLYQNQLQQIRCLFSLWSAADLQHW